MDLALSIKTLKNSIKYILALLLFATLGCEFNPKPAPNCNSKTFTTPGIHHCGIMHNNLLRWYQIYIPTEYQGEPTPLVVDLHGAGSPITFGNSAQQFVVSHFDKVAERHNFVAIWPQGINMLWINDQEFLFAVMDEVQQLLTIDATRIYATGVSMGGAFSHSLGCQFSNRFAAIAPVASPILLDQLNPCRPSAPLPVFTVHSPTDMIVPFKGSISNMSAPATFALWSGLNNCVDEAAVILSVGDSTCWEHSVCDAGVSVKFCSVDSKGLFLGGHLPYLNNDDLKISEMIWEFFEQYERL